MVVNDSLVAESRAGAGSAAGRWPTTIQHPGKYWTPLDSHINLSNVLDVSVGTSRFVMAPPPLPARWPESDLRRRER